MPSVLVDHEHFKKPLPKVLMDGAGSEYEIKGLQPALKASSHIQPGHTFKISSFFSKQWHLSFV